MRVLFITKHYPPSEGGIERYSHLLCTGLVRSGIEVEVVAAAEDQRHSSAEMIDGVKVHRLGTLLGLSGAPISPGLPRLLSRLAPRFDLLHLNFPNPWTELAYLCFGRRKQAVLTYHGDIFRQKLFLRLYSPFIHILMRQMSAIIATSTNYVNSSPVLARYREKCRVIPLPVDTASLQPVETEGVEAMRRQYGEFVLFVGRLVYYKGLEHLIEAVGLLQDIRLVVVGRGPLEGTCRDLVARLKLDARVTFLGKIPDEDLRALYCACQCFVLPSVARSEAFGMVLAEAMASGRPVISTELSTGTSFVNLDNETGFVVPPGNAVALAQKIKLLFENKELQYKFGQQARQRVEQLFRQEIMIGDTLRLYREVLA